MKKGISNLITWVLLIGFAVSFSIIIGRYMTQSAEQQSEQTVKFIEMGLICEKILLSVESTEIQGSNIKSITIKNRGYLSIDGIMARAYYERDPPINVQEQFNGINPNEEISVAVSIPVVGIKTLEILPLKKLEGCATSKVTLSCEEIENLVGIDYLNC